MSTPENDPTPPDRPDDAPPPLPDDLSRYRHKIPVPPEIIEQALRDFNEAEILAELEEVRRTGGVSSEEFLRELERLLGPEE